MYLEVKCRLRKISRLHTLPLYFSIKNDTMRMILSTNYSLLSDSYEIQLKIDPVEIFSA